MSVPAVSRPGEGWLPPVLGRRPTTALLVLAATLLLWNLGGHGLWESTEARYAEISARMVRSGDWLTPRLNFIVHFEKPPLTYWATAAGMVALGVGEAGARIGLVLAALATLLIVARWPAGQGPPAAGLFASLCLLSAPLFFALSRSVTTDLYLTLWVTAAVDAGRRGTRPGGARGWRLAAWACFGAGLLTKGHVMLLWTVLPALAWAAWAGEWGRLRRLLDPFGILLALVVALPWYVIEIGRHPGLVDFWLGRQTAARVLEPFRGESEPWWHYLGTVAWAGWLWTLPAALELWRRRRERPYEVAWIVLPMVAFSLFPTKRPNYVLPLLPPLALAAGAWWASADRLHGVLTVRILATITAALGAGLLAAAPFLEVPRTLAALGPLLGPGFLLGALAAWRAAGRRRFDLALAGLVIPLLGLYAAGFTALGRPSVEAWFKISRPLARAAAAAHHPGEPIVAFHDWPRAFPFYLNERLITVTEEGRETRFERDDAWRRYVYTEEEDVARFADRPGALFYLPRDRRGRLEELLGHRVVVLAATRRHLLAAQPRGVGRPYGLTRTPTRPAGPRRGRRSGRSRGGP